MQRLITIFFIVVLLCSCTKDNDYHLYIIENNGKYGFINSSGSIVIDPIYIKVKDYSEGLAYFEATDNIRGFIDKNGEVVFTLNDEIKNIGYFSEGYVAFKTKKNKYGYLDNNGQIVIDDLFKYAGEFHSGLAEADDGVNKGYIDKSGSFAIRNPYEYMIPFSEDIGIIRSSNYSYYISKSGSKLFGKKWSHALPFSNNLAAVMNDDMKWGFIDSHGKLIIDYQYDWVSSFSDEIALVGIGSYEKYKYFYINKDNKKIIDFEKKELLIGKSFSNGMAPVKKSNLMWTYINKDGYMLKNEYYDADPFNGNLAVVCLDLVYDPVYGKDWPGNKAYINVNGDVISLYEK